MEIWGKWFLVKYCTVSINSNVTGHRAKIFRRFSSLSRVTGGIFECWKHVTKSVKNASNNRIFAAAVLCTVALWRKAKFDMIRVGRLNTDHFASIVHCVLSSMARWTEGLYNEWTYNNLGTSRSSLLTVVISVPPKIRVVLAWFWHHMRRSSATFCLIFEIFYVSRLPHPIFELSSSNARVTGHRPFELIETVQYAQIRRQWIWPSRPTAQCGNILHRTI